jgi:hypothetical protein
MCHQKGQGGKHSIACSSNFPRSIAALVIVWQVPTRQFSPKELEPWKGVVSPFSPKVYEKAFEVVPVQEVRQLNLAWLIPFKVRKQMQSLLMWHGLGPMAPCRRFEPG